MNTENVTQPDNSGTVTTQFNTPTETPAVAVTPQAPEISVKDSLESKIAETKKATATAAKPSQSETPAESTSEPTYTPNFKFRVHKEEKEIPEKFRALIKDAASEKEIREIFEKAYGLDVQKPKHEQLKTEFAQVKEKYTNLDRSLNTLSKFVQKDDLGAFFDAIQVPFDQVARFVHRELAKRELPPQERERQNAFEMDRRRLVNLEQENEILRNSHMSSTTQAKQLELQTSLARPEIAQVASKVDELLGKPGAFLNEVISMGITTYQLTNQELPVEQAINEVAQRWNAILGKTQTPSVPNPAAPAAPQAPKTPPPTIPNVSGQGASPIKQGPKSINDLKKLAAASAG